MRWSVPVASFGLSAIAAWQVLVWYYRGVVRREARGRPDALFDPDDPAAVYAELVPRRPEDRVLGDRHRQRAGPLDDAGRRGEAGPRAP